MSEAIKSRTRRVRTYGEQDFKNAAILLAIGLGCLIVVNRVAVWLGDPQTPTEFAIAVPTLAVAIVGLYLLYAGMRSVYRLVRGDNE